MIRMKSLFSGRTAKAIVDILLTAGLLLSIHSARRSADSWGSFHCIISMVWYALMLLHIWQHWRLTKALVKWKVMRRNVVTSLTVLAFMLMTFSVITFVADINDPLVRIHHVAAHVFWAVIIIHAVTKAKRFVSIFRSRSV